ncbi:MAG: hypothetical protein CML22_07255 [Rheinheimera sp.]|nr:hypothetical protein [Rheinheimera sp.]MBM34081.1 hypothetical protein [Rheinheimera sp.]
MDNAIRDYKNQSADIRQHIHDAHKAITRQTASLTKLNEERRAQSFLEKLSTYFTHRKRARAIEETLIEQKHKSRRYTKEQAKHRKQFLEAFFLAGISNSDQSIRISELKKAYSSASKVTQSAKTTLEYAKKAINEISEASSSVSSAQTMEVIDMFSSNKGIAMMSSLSTASASSEIDDASRAIKRFTDALGQHSKMVAKISDPMNMEWLDLGFDLAGVDLGFDFSSIFSFLALSSASSDLDAASRKIKETLPGLKSQLTRCSDASTQLAKELSAIAKEVCRPALETLQSAGIEVTESELANTMNSVCFVR